MTYTPELGQGLFGNNWSAYNCPGYVERGLYALAERIGNYDDSKTHGYGHDHSNDIFEMHPYFWGECQCGFEEADWEWSESHDHADTCYQSELERRYAAAGATNEMYPGDGLPFDLKHRLVEILADEWGLSRHGCAVHCTCSHDDDYQEWRQANDHDPACGVVAPNFRHRSGLEVRWYKYIGRGMSINKEISGPEWATVLRECEDSLV